MEVQAPKNVLSSKSGIRPNKNVLSPIERPLVITNEPVKKIEKNLGGLMETFKLDLGVI